ncbi:phosphate/phosphite/phosphonate ABC transporter substrate-binding protein [Nitrosopumilus adriaticus]|uniref:ABC-type phosphate/phosphonate transport system periplasmic component-like protein n=1 Tax=Nitrosopumilus adriaticus TaxID=1580092 RepID=A0A0D5C543_9ARCH|nr:phosphate/phosphite/phosphonate ABC transporter substrate-binding protein [Nitrosopumilus adriaticus]AJW71475.1 ABC-type phosphate/phosphonate transport system periplasmic component-like protein [Nitrosopumilus adriaticus]
MKLYIILGIIGIAIVSGMIGYQALSSADDVENNVVENTDTTSSDYELFTIGTIHRDSAKMVKRYQPLADYIAEKISDENKMYKGKVMILPSQEKMIEAINNHEMDLYFDSPLIGIKIMNDAEIEPFLLSWKEGHREYHTVFITAIDSEITFDNLFNKTLVFEDTESTSGYYLPVIHLQNAGYDIDLDGSEDFSFVFSNDDENTPVWILEGKGDVGATSNLDFEDIPANIKERVKIIESTESLPRQMVFVGNHVEQQDELKEILLDMDDNSNSLEILGKISDTSKFSEINWDEDFEISEKLMGLLK